MRFILSLVVLFSLNNSAFASAGNGFANRDKWLKDLSPQMKEGLCKPGSHFRKCFTATAEECTGLAEKSFAYCTARYKGDIPAKLTEPEFNVWSLKIKACMGASMSIAFEDAKKAVQSEACEASEKPGSDTETVAVPVDVYLDQLSLTMPQDLCLDSMPHRACYSVTQAECRKGIAKAIQECIPELKGELPAKITLAENKDFDISVVQCLSPRFDKVFSGKRAKSGPDYCGAAFAAAKPKAKAKGAK
jgi:hypothetical protein